jgi:hypothetical protein
MAQPMPLLDRGGLGVSLRDDQPAELGSEFARDPLPYRLAEGVAEADGAVGEAIGEEDAPAVVGHFHRPVICPALGVDSDRGAQVDVGRGEVVRSHLAPPVEETRLPVLESALQRLVVRQVDVVGDLLAVVDAHVCSALRF